MFERELCDDPFDRFTELASGPLPFRVIGDAGRAAHELVLRAPPTFLRAEMVLRQVRGDGEEPRPRVAVRSPRDARAERAQEGFLAEIVRVADPAGNPRQIAIDFSVMLIHQVREVLVGHHVHLDTARAGA